MYSSKELEYIFVEILVPYKQNLIVGTIYNHPPIKRHKFCNIFTKLQSKLKNQNKILSGDLNLNLLGYNKKLCNINWKAKTTCGNFTTLISDHFPQFLIMEDFT